jgi:PAS domain S-box-containing protein
MFTLRFTPLVIPVLAAAALSAVLLLIQLRRQAATGSRSLIILTTGMLIWTATYGLELVAVDPRARFIFFVAKYLGVVIVPAAWFTFALAYTGHEEVLSLRNIALLTIEPALTILFAATNSLHHLFWTSVRPVSLEVNTVLMVDFGPAFWVHAAYSYLLILAGTILMIRAFIITPHHYRGQVVTLLLSVIAPWAGNVMYLSRLNPFPYLDLTPFGFTLTVVFITLSMLRFNLLDLVPIARRHVIQSMSDAMLVLDGYDRILDANPAALHLFGSITPEALFEQSVADLLPPWSAIAEAGHPLDKEPVFKLAVGGDQREYQMNISPVYDQHGNLKGRVIVLRNITRQRQSEQALHESEERFRMLFHHSPDAIVLLDPSIDDPSWPIVDCNEAFLAMNGFSRDELIGQSIDMVHETEEDPERRLAFLSQLQRKGRFESEGIHRRKDGTTYPVHFLSALVNLNGKQLVLGIDRDITERKRAEQALHESEERFRVLFHHSPDAIVLLDPHADDPLLPIVDCNEAFLKMNGFSRDELIGQSIDTVHATEGTPERRRDFLEQLEREGMVEGEIIHQRKGGTTYPVHFMATLVNLNGKQLMLGVDRDITERKQAEQALHESEERFRMLFHHSPDAIVLFDPSVEDPLWPIVDCNEAFLSMNGYSREELIGQSIELVNLSPTSWEKHMGFLSRLKKNSPVEGENVHRRKDGTIYPIHFMTTLVTLKGKQLIMGVDRDITAQKQTEQAMHESEERFRMLFHHSPDAIVLLDPSVDDPSWPILDCNEAFLSMNGFSREELIGQSIDMVHETEEDPEKRQAFLRRLKREGRVESEVTHYRRDGTTYPVHFLTALVKLGGKQLVLGIDRDISERKQAEAEIRRYRDHLEELVAERTAELHEANLKISASLQEKEVLLKEIHHRVKNNLQVISSLLNLQSGYVKDETAVTLFTESRNRVHSMALIHEQLYRSADFTRVDFATYVQELTRRLLVSYRALANGIDLRLSLDKIYLDVTTAIPCGLIINELVSNALKHAFPDGQPGIIRVEMETVDEAGYRLVVRNDGIAFPEGLDFRSTDTLGLQLVNSLTRQLGGQIDLYTEVDTTFEIRFPRSE